MQVRFIPPTLESGEVFYSRRMHYNFKIGDKLKAVECLRTVKQPCPACEFFFEFKDDEEYAKAVSALRPNTKFFAAFIIRERESEGIKVWGFPTTLFTQLKDLYNEQLKAGEVPFTGNANGENGHDILISRVGSGINNTKYSYTPLTKRSNLVDISPEWANDGFVSLEATVDRTVLGANEFVDAFKTSLTELGVNAEEVMSAVGSESSTPLPF